MSSSQIQVLKDAENTDRNFKRFPLQFSVTITPSFGHDSLLSRSSVTRFPAIVTDVSVSGLSFRTVEEFCENSVLLVTISIGPNNFCIPVIVRRLKRLPNATQTIFACGVEFIKSEATAKFIPMLAKHLLSQGVVKRSLIKDDEPAAIHEDPAETDEIEIQAAA